jgi:tetratricopeptide (TPR) repeat protein
MIIDLPDAEFVQLVNMTFKSYHSVLALARSLLADSPLVTPLLVLDDVSPTADERGQALRLVLQWAVHQLAPAEVQYPPGVYRPPDDPTWRDPLWWRYNILRHRYLEPLHPDEFVEGGRFTETLMSLTGIPSADTLFDERNRAIREAAQWLRQQMLDGRATEELQQLALDAAYRPLQTQPTASALLSIAATFDDVFPRALLLHMAADEHLPNPGDALDYLARHRFLQEGDEAQNLWLSPVLRRYIYARQPKGQLYVRHRRAALYYAAEHEPLPAARHLQGAQRWSEAAALLLDAVDDLLEELEGDDLCTILSVFRDSQLPPDQWREVQILLGDLHARSGRQTEALAACRQALQAAPEPTDQARIYRRMGKLYEKHNPPHALGYYQQAAERFPPDHPELLQVLKDRGWLHILRQEWNKAEQDLTLAVAHAGDASPELQADVFDALSNLNRHRKRYEPAVSDAQRALALREASGDLARVANSFNNLGLLYNDMGDYHHALHAYEEAIGVYQKLGNRGLIAGALVNVGMAYHLDGRLPAAVHAYQKSLDLCAEIGLPLVEVRAHYNLAEALAALDDGSAARRHWQAGVQVSTAAGFDDMLADFRSLLKQFPILQEIELSLSRLPQPPADPTPAPMPSGIEPREREVLALAQKHGQVTAKALMTAMHISKATATRRLAELAARGVLEKFGDGRGTYYTLPTGDGESAARRRSTLAPGPKPGPRQEQAQEDLEEDYARMRRVLHWQSSRLADDFGLAALGLTGERWGGERHALLPMIARFERQPDLARFFDLEHFLSTLLDAPLHLAPEDVWRSRGNAVHAVMWVWQQTESTG